MAILPVSDSYVNKDFAALRARLFDAIRSVFPEWTDDATANFGNLLVESFAFVGDVLTYYQDQQAREARWGTVELRRNAIALAKLIGYELPLATEATCDVVMTLTNASAIVGTVSPVGGVPVVVATNEVTTPVRGQLDAPVSFALGETTKTFTWRHRLTQSPYTIVSTNRPDQIVRLPFGPFLWDSETVSTSIDGTFTRVDSFLDSGPTAKHYRVDVDHNDLATVQFGDGRNGKIPAGNITCTWSIGGGSEGNVEPGGLSIVETELRDTAGNRAYFTVTNAARANGGGPREEVAAARVNAPNSLRVLTRTVAREDFEINARRVPGVGRALMLTSNEYVGIDENAGELYIIPLGGGTPSQGLLDDVYTMCTVTYPCTVTFRLEVLAAVYKTIDVEVTVWLRENQTASAVRAAILAALEDYFEPMLTTGAPNPSVGFGYEYKDEDGNPAGQVPWSDVFNVVRDVTGVRKVDPGMQLNGGVTSVDVANYQFPALGTVTIRDGRTGNAL
jgi:hypothetical protein